jgi:hypothetical protein
MIKHTQPEFVEKFSQMPGISRKAFWDVNFEEPCLKRDRLFIIQRLFDYGLFDELIVIIKWYGRENIREDIVKANWLQKKTISFCCALFDLQPQDFKCYTKRQLNPQHWEY